MGNVDGHPLALADGEAAPQGQHGLVLGALDKNGVGRVAVMADNGAIAVGPPHDGQQVWADFFKVGMVTGEYHIALELNYNIGQQYRHVGGTHFVLCSVVGGATKSIMASEWDVLIGVIIRIDGTSADVAWMHNLSLHSHDQTTVHVPGTQFGACVDLAMTSPPDLDKVAVGDKQIGILAVNTGLTLPEISGTPKTPARGDVIMRADRITGSGTIEVAYNFEYYGVPV